eukprot:1421902-Amphidinium_carterae.3
MAKSDSAKFVRKTGYLVNNGPDPAEVKTCSNVAHPSMLGKRLTSNFMVVHACEMVFQSQMFELELKHGLELMKLSAEQSEKTPGEGGPAARQGVAHHKGDVLDEG